MSLLYNEVAQEQAAARLAWETQQYSMDRLWGLPSISDDILPAQTTAARASQNRVPTAAPSATGAAGSAVGIKPAGVSAAARTDYSTLPPPPGVPDTRPAHVIDPTWGRVGRSYSQSKPKVPRTGRASGETDRHSGGKAGKSGKKEKKRRVVRQRNAAVSHIICIAFFPSYALSASQSDRCFCTTQVVKDPNKPKPTPWSDAELAHFRHLLDTEGPNAWAAKAAKLGTGNGCGIGHASLCWSETVNHGLGCSFICVCVRESARACASPQDVQQNRCTLDGCVMRVGSLTSHEAWQRCVRQVLQQASPQNKSEHSRCSNPR